MKQRLPRARITAANDNFPVRHHIAAKKNALPWDRSSGARPLQDISRMPFLPHRGGPLAPPEPFRIGARPLLIVGFSVFVLVALCGAFLIGLAVVGLMAVVIVAFELVRRLSRPARTPLGALDHQVVG
jgi:hypothetical protein